MKTLPIRLGLIGCGRVVQGIHGPAFLSMPDAVKVVALADPVPENLEPSGDLFGVPPALRYADDREMLDGTDLDAVSIATPHALHAEQVIRAAGAGVAVVSEKPMAASLADADAILSAVTSASVPYTVVHNLLFSPAMAAAFARLGGGAVGRPIFGRGQIMGLKPADLSDADWRASRAAGGGCLIDSAYHEIYSVEALVGSSVRYVEARVRTLSLDIDVDDTAMLLLEHEDGAISTVSASWCAPGLESGRWCEVHTGDGSLRVRHRPDDPLWGFVRGAGWKALPLPATGEDADPTGHAGFFAAAFEALAAGTRMPVTGEEARHNLAIIEAARRASAERRAVEVEDDGFHPRWTSAQGM